MATAASSNAADKLFESLQNDLKNLSMECRKKYPHIKENCEEALVKIRNAAVAHGHPVPSLYNQILHPFTLGCESKDNKICKLCIGTIQRVILAQVVDERGGKNIVDTLWVMMETGVEEVRVLQTVTLLLTTNNIVQGVNLSRALVLCFRLHFTKDSTTVSTAGATVRQLVALVFERALAEDRANEVTETSDQVEDLKLPSAVPPKTLLPCAQDAFLMFQDLIQMVNLEQPLWLTGLTEMTRTFGLELLESVLVNFSDVFYKHPEFTFILKERVCAMVIKLFSPNIKYRQPSISSQTQSGVSSHHDKPNFSISMRLLRLVSVLIQKYYSLLITQCEIFLSLLIKFLEPEKPGWQRSLALEVLHKLLVQSELLAAFCESYDMKQHSTRCFQDMINSLGAYVQSLFVNPQLLSQSLNTNAQMAATQSQPPALIAGMPVGAGVSPQPAFYYRGVCLPLVNPPPSGISKPVYLEMLDKLEAPIIPEGYGVTIAYCCLMDTVRSLSLVVTGPAESEMAQEYEATEEQKAMHTQLISSSWCGLLSALSLLLEASTEECPTENILKAMQTYCHLCGCVEQNVPRDAFVTALCKASLPPHYTLTVLSAAGTSVKACGHEPTLGQYLGTDNEPRQQVVVVGAPLPTASLPPGAQQGPVMLTAKNLQVMRCILSVAHCHGGILGSAWHLILTTLQHLVWILGLKPSTGGSLKAGRPSNDAVITHAVMADLPVLSTMLSRLFESSQYLDDVALHHLIDALCKLSQEAMELAYSNREPSLFAVAKLLETGVVNLARVGVLWRPVTNHLLEVCAHPYARMREWGVEALTYLVRSALQYHHTPPLAQNQKLQCLLLTPLSELSPTPYADTRSKQLECILQVLHSAGENLSGGWPLVLNIIGSLNPNHGETLVRTAFQCVQLVVTDFLPIMPWSCLPLCVETAGKFGGQTLELNTSLTAIGLMWNISDYFYQNQDKLRVAEAPDNKIFPEFPGVAEMPPFDKLWMCLYTKLGELCVDSRPAVRKSASQTLFSTISAHGSLLHNDTWQAVLWQVLFPLLDKVRTLSVAASSDRVDSGGNILIHHSRNTAQKQWSETQVLTLSGVARVFNVKRSILMKLGDFPRAWALLLEFIENSALSKNNEVSLAALKAFQEILNINRSSQAEMNGCIPEDGTAWSVAWKSWHQIGIGGTEPPEDASIPDVYVPSQPFLTALTHIFPSLFQWIKGRFFESDLEKLCNVLQRTVAVPVHGEASAFILPSINEVVLTPLQEGVLNCMELLLKEVKDKSFDHWEEMIPPLLNQLLEFSRYSCQAPVYGKMEIMSVTQLKNAQNVWVTMNYVPFAERALSLALSLYQQSAHLPAVIKSRCLKRFVQTVSLCLGLKYACASQTSWRQAVSALLASLKTGLPLARKFPEEHVDFWPVLADTLNGFLFSKSNPPPSQTVEEGQSDEAVDCQVVELIRSEILHHAETTPKEFTLKLMLLLNMGSIHSASSGDGTGPVKVREEFAKLCFETLLQHSLLVADSELSGKLAVTSLLHRFQEVLSQYTRDEASMGKCPLPRHRMAEISFVLKAIATLISSLKKAPAEKVEVGTWEQLIELYPHLVACTTTNSAQVAQSLQDVLYHYKHLLSPPQYHPPASVPNGL